MVYSISDYQDKLKRWAIETWNIETSIWAMSRGEDTPKSQMRVWSIWQAYPYYVHCREALDNIKHLNHIGSSSFWGYPPQEHF